MHARVQLVRAVAPECISTELHNVSVRYDYVVVSVFQHVRLQRAASAARVRLAARPCALLAQMDTSQAATVSVSVW